MADTGMYCPASVVSPGTPRRQLTALLASNVEHAVIASVAQRLLSRYEDWVTHFEVVVVTALPDTHAPSEVLGDVDALLWFEAVPSHRRKQNIHAKSRTRNKKDEAIRR
jgi:hypothetical protein